MGVIHADFTGDVAVVSGGSSGIGFAIVSALARAGAAVHALDIAPLPEPIPGVTAHEVDLRDTTAVEECLEHVIKEDGRIDLLVHSAGVTRDGVSWKLGEEDWETVLDVNLGGAFRLVRGVAGFMRERRRGRVVLISSINGMRGRFGQTNYCASKSGLIGLGRAAAREFGGRGITVNTIAPGMIATPMTMDLPEEVRTRSIGETCLGNIGKPSDVCSAVMFLLSDQAAHITGTVIPVDGGQLA